MARYVIHVPQYHPSTDGLLGYVHAGEYDEIPEWACDPWFDGTVTDRNYVPPTDKVCLIKGEPPF